MARLILASSSPRRRELLEQVGGVVVRVMAHFDGLQRVFELAVLVQLAQDDIRLEPLADAHADALHALVQGLTGKESITALTPA